MFIRMILILSLTLYADVQAAGFTLSSTDVQGQISNDQVFNSFGCTGKNISPQLSWTNVPEGTKSFAVTVYDPDAPTGSGWWHWLVFNIPESVSSIKTGASVSSGSDKAMPVGAVESVTSYGSAGFGGACPPKDDKPHRYIFTVFALNTKKIEQDKNARPELIGFFLNSHTIAKASIMAYYGR